jgi:sugar/nucleoside kinase (ribokinase family)
MKLAKEANCKVSIDLSDSWTVSRHKETLQYLLSNYVDIVFANEDEVLALTGLSPEDGCLKLQEICPIAVVTLGPDGCLVGHKDKIITVATYPATVLDTTGAGDLFACGFLYGYLHNYPLLACARIGNRLGSSIVEVIGAELPKEKWGEIQSFLNDPANLL